MIVYVTGAPGSGKTLWTITEVLKMLKAEPDRPVYYFFPEHVPDVDASLNWHRIKDRAEVHAVPARSIVILDEAWTWYPQRKASTRPPDDVEAYATHRHRGHDFFIMTQRVTSVDHFIRGLVGRHVHFERQFGLERSRKFEWQKMGDPGDRFSKQEAMASEFRFPKEVYKLYRSAEVHTVKKKLPVGRLAGIAGMLAAIPVLLYIAASFVLDYDTGAGPESPPVASEASGEVQTSPATPETFQTPAEAWIARFVPRVEELPFSAPIYDDLAQPVSMPKVSGCVDIVSPELNRCACYTQQGTRIRAISTRYCRQLIADGGWFDFTEPDTRDHQRTANALPPVYADESMATAFVPGS